MSLSKDINSNVQTLKKFLRTDESFDFIYRTIEINNRTACMFFIDGFAKDEIMEKILEYFYSINDEAMLKDAHTFSKKCIPHIEVDITNSKEKIATSILSGMTILIIDGFEEALLIDSRTYPQRDTSEPEKDKVLRGSKDGFVETLISNTSLIRRRIRDVNLTIKVFNVGKESKTDVALCYMENKVDKKLLNETINKLKNANVEALTMNQQSLIEAIYKHKWYNPLPKVKHSERPDTTAAAILDGNIAILVDNSPLSLILPTSIFDVIEEADDYYFPPLTGSYLRLSRYIISFVTLFLTPAWLLMIQNPQYIPQSLDFVYPSESINIPIFWQLVILELVIDGLRLASLHTPTSISTTLSIIGAITLSDFSVKSGWFNTETMLYMAFVAMSNYSQPSFELGYALKFFRLMLLILTAIFNICGFVAGLIIILILLISNKTISGKSYLYPLIPFNRKAFLDKVIRTRIKTLDQN